VELLDMKWCAVAVFLIVSVCGFSQTTQSKNTSNVPSWYITDTGAKVVHFDGTADYISVDGMWYATSAIPNKQLIAPIVVKIECTKSAAVCREVDATVAMGILRPDTTDYAISTWTAERIAAEDSDEGACKISHRLVVDFKSKTVTLTDLPSQVDTPECKMYKDANSYILHSGQVMLFPWARYDPLAKKEK
jgi:hypothetical protein